MRGLTFSTSISGSGPTTDRTSAMNSSGSKPGSMRPSRSTRASEGITLIFCPADTRVAFMVLRRMDSKRLASPPRTSMASSERVGSRRARTRDLRGSRSGPATPRM